MITVGVLFGGKSGEHEVSRCSGASVVSALDRSKYCVTAIGIDYDGRWYVQKEPVIVNDPSFGKVLEIKKEGKWIADHSSTGGSLVIRNEENGKEIAVDCVFPVLHGTYGEDGTLQGLLDLAGVPYVGAGVLGSSVGMDKDITKRILRDAGIPVVPWITVRRSEWERSSDKIIENIGLEIGFPCFIKPVNAGSSVGVHKIKSRTDVRSCVEDSLKYDLKAIIEKCVDAREIECAVLGNEEPKASVLGEVIPNHEFYSYEAKYIDVNGADLEIPADLDPEIAQRIRDCAVKGYSALQITGMARVDFFLDRKTGEYFLNEPNTLPGFTSISMYPKLWEATGIPYPKLLDELVRLAFERASERATIKTVYARSDV